MRKLIIEKADEKFSVLGWLSKNISEEEQRKEIYELRNKYLSGEKVHYYREEFNACDYKIEFIIPTDYEIEEMFLTNIN